MATNIANSRQALSGESNAVDEGILEVALDYI